MARITVNQGLQESLDNEWGLQALDAIDAMCVSNFGTLSSTTTTVAAATSKDANGLDAGTSRTNQTVTVTATWGTGEANFQITTVTLHRDGVGAFTGVYGGVDGQSVTKTVDFSLKITMTDTRTSA